MTDLTARVARLLPKLYPGWDHMGTGWRHKARADTHALLARLDTAGELVPDNAADFDVDGYCCACSEYTALPPIPTLADLIDAARNHTCDDDRGDELDAEGRRDDAI